MNLFEKALSRLNLINRKMITYEGAADVTQALAHHIDEAIRTVTLFSSSPEIRDPKITQAISKARERRVNIAIAHDGGELIFPTESGIKEYPSVRMGEKNHFLVTDRINVIEEELHLPEGSEQTAYYTRGGFFLGKFLEIKFGSYTGRGLR